MTLQQQKTIAGFFRSEYGRMAGYVRTLIDDAADHESDDIVQDIAVNIFSRADITAPINDLASYVYQALRNRAVDMIRRRRHDVSLDRPLDERNGVATLKDSIVDEQADIERIMDNGHIKRQLMDSIEALPEDQKAVLVATEFDGRSFAELSAEWHVPVGTLLARKSRAIARLRRMLDKE